MYNKCYLIGIVLLINQNVFAQNYLISNPDRIEDVSLLDGEFGNLNFGGGYFLEAGKMVGIYVEHNAESLIRFNLEDVKCNKVISARLRLYKPNCFIQKYPVEVGIYKVCNENGNWKEGSGICEKDKIGCSWDFIDGNRPWAENPKGSNNAETALDVKSIPANNGLWVEFELPADLVQSWLVNPNTNTGLKIVMHNKINEWGEHVYFYSSEHFSGKGPQLIIKGTGKSNTKTTISNNISKKRHQFSTINENDFEKWLISGRRLANFTVLSEMDRGQAKVFYYYDIIFRKDFLLERYQIPLGETFLHIEEAISKNDDKETRKLMNDVRAYLLVWEYLRETDWYTSGPLADVLSPWQLTALFGKGIFGRMQESAEDNNETIWKTYDEKSMAENMDKTMDLTAKKLQLTFDATNKFRKVLNPIERNEQMNLMQFRDDLNHVQKSYQEKLNDVNVMQEIKNLHFHHEVFLYYQSIYNTPRWFYFLDNSPVIPFAKWIVETRKRVYTKEANQKQINEIKEYRTSSLKD